MERTILHCDMNGFYASVEIMLNPDLRGKAVAVCGATETRHGIVLAKSELAKKAGVKTGMPNWEAEKLCPNLILVPPHYEQYIKYSRLARAIYEEYTDLVEPYGMDECFLDVTDSVKLFGSGEAIANELRQRMKDEMGLTISVGVSYNKVLAKMGSDMKKPDAVTVIEREDLPVKLWPLPVGDLFYCGRATTRKLKRYSIHTIGDLAKADPKFIQNLLGKNGVILQGYAQGIDVSPVASRHDLSPIKSIGHGITCVADLYTPEDVWRVMLELAQDVGHKLRIHHLKARGVQISVRHKDLFSLQRQGKLSSPTRVPLDIALQGKKLFEELVASGADILPARAVTIRAIDLQDENAPYIDSLFDDVDKSQKRQKLYDTIDDLRKRYGKEIVREAVLLEDTKMPQYRDHDLTLPGMMNREKGKK